MFRLVVLGKNEAVAAFVANDDDVAVLAFVANEALVDVKALVANEADVALSAVEAFWAYEADVAILAVDALDTLFTVTASVVPSPWLKVIVALATDELK
jgi:hypothetical protein